ncbi:MAG: FixH family protein [Burkholderiales bacterium]|nr:FixH family protein [Burkholderiales bacterium]
MQAQAMKMGKPWYREGWAWFVLTPPLLAVVAGLVTVAIAVENRDQLVDKQYYESGITINQQMKRMAEARVLGVSANLQIEGDVLHVALNAGGATLPARLHLRAQYASGAHVDRDLILTAVGPGDYRLDDHALAPGRWYMALEDDQHRWLLHAEAELPATHTVAFVPEQGLTPAA